MRFLTLLTLSLFVSTTFALTLPQTVPYVDINRYVGDWYEIGRTPTPFQDKCGAAQASYGLRKDGRVDVLNQCLSKTNSEKVYKAKAIAKVIDTVTNAKLKVNFIPILQWFDFFSFLGGDYWILALDPDYQFVLVGTPDFKYFWVLSRTKTLDFMVLHDLLTIAATQGFNVKDFSLSPVWP